MTETTANARNVKLTLRAIAEITGLAVATVSMFYISRIVGPEYIGFYATSSAVLALVTKLGDGGLTALASQRLAREDARLETLLTVTVLPKILLSVLLAACTLLILQIVHVDQRLRYFLLISLSMVILESCSQNWVFVSLGRINVTSLMRIVQSLVYGACVFLLIQTQEDWRWLPFLMVINSLITASMSIFFLVHFQLCKIDKTLFGHDYFRLVRSYFTEGFHFLKADLSSYVYTTSDRLFLYYFTTPAVVGIYEAAYKIINPFYNINTIISPTMFRELAQSFKQGKLYPVMAKYTFYMSIFTIPLGFFLLYFPDFVIHTLYGARFAESARSLAVLGFVITFGFTSGIIVIPFSAWNMSREFGNSILWGNILNLLLNVALIPVWGAIGAALATVAAKVIVTIVGYVYFRRATDYHIVTDFKWFFFASALPLLLLPLINRYVQNSYLLVLFFGTLYLALVAVAYQVHFRTVMHPATHEVAA